MLRLIGLALLVSIAPVQLLQASARGEEFEISVTTTDEELVRQVCFEAYKDSGAPQVHKETICACYSRRAYADMTEDQRRVFRYAKHMASNKRVNPVQHLDQAMRVHKAEMGKFWERLNENCLDEVFPPDPIDTASNAQLEEWAEIANSSGDEFMRQIAACDSITPCERAVAIQFLKTRSQELDQLPELYIDGADMARNWLKKLVEEGAR